jgi:hypothetical protein
MNNWDGAPIDEAFNIIGVGSKKNNKQANKSVPRDAEPNLLNKDNYENNMEEVFSRYNKIIESLVKEVKDLSNKIEDNYKYKKSDSLIEGFSPGFTINNDQIDQLIQFIFAGILIILVLNYIFV